jgi:hypothetical protein
MVWATAIKGTKLLRLTLYWIAQPWCLVIYFGNLLRVESFFIRERHAGCPPFALFAKGWVPRTYFSPLNWCIFRRSRLDGLPCGAGLKIIPAFRS